jgi:hypothetical protein
MPYRSQYWRRGLTVIAFVGQHIPTALARTALATGKADLLQQGHEIARVSVLPR